MGMMLFGLKLLLKKIMAETSQTVKFDRQKRILGGKQYTSDTSGNFIKDDNNSRMIAQGESGKRAILGKRESGSFGLLENDDWKDLEPEKFSVFSVSDSNVVIQVSDIDYSLSSRFAISDRVRIDQYNASTTNLEVFFFYIYDIDTVNDRLHLIGDFSDPIYNDDPTNDYINYFAYSRLPAPINHPVNIDFTPTMSASGSMTVTGSTTDAVRIRMIGKLMEVEVVFSISLTLGGVAAGTVYGSLPIEKGLFSNVAQTLVLATDGDGTRVAAAMQAFDPPTGSRGGFRIEKLSGANWVLGSSFSVSGIITFKIDS